MWPAGKQAALLWAQPVSLEELKYILCIPMQTLTGNNLKVTYQADVHAIGILSGKTAHTTFVYVAHTTTLRPH